MAIVGVGIDLVDVRRFAEILARSPRVAERLLSLAERERPAEGQAARFAAKEALAKALGAPGGLHWQDAEVVRLPGQRPTLEIRGTVAAAAAAIGVRRVHLSLSHDGGMATALVVAES